MDENLYLQCKKLKIDIDRNATNIKGCQVILNYLEKQKSNSIEYYELALDQLLFMMKSVHLEALDIRIGFSNYTYKKKYLDIISPILQMIDLSGSRRGFQGLRYLNILGNALNGTDVEIILDYNWDSETGQSSLSKLVMETLIENASYTEEELKRDLKSALVERYITGKILMDDTEPLIKKGRFELVYLWGNHIYDIPEAREIYFSRDLNISLLGDTFIIEKNPVYSEIPKAFFGEKIRSVHAVIGKNGSGKSSVFELISNCSIFGPTGFPEGLGEYFLIYKVEGEYFYANTTDKRIEIKDSSLQILHKKIQSELRICKISNVFDLYRFDSAQNEISQVIDLTTQSIIRDGEGERLADVKRVQNYQKIIQSRLSEGTKADRFENKVVKDMNQFSSGERARITLFARILSLFCVDDAYQIKDGQESGIAQPDIVSNYIFMFDEAELYFHPAWQRKLVKDLCDFFTWIDQELLGGEGFENITLLLSSNSPFYMSDLPGSMIHRLGYEGERSKETFGQNIYSLLKSKFFMEEGVIGAFAQNKINHVLRELSDYKYDEESGQETNALKEIEEIPEDSWKEIEYVVDIMGDPFLKDVMKEQPRYKRKIDQN